MSDLENTLKIKFGLENSPDINKINEWLDKSSYYINLGIEEEIAGEKAAKDVFEDYYTWVYKSQSDTITALLAQAREKVKNKNGN